VSTSIAIDQSSNISEHVTDLQGVALGKVLEPIACNVNTVLNIKPVQNLIIFCKLSTMQDSNLLIMVFDKNSLNCESVQDSP